MKRSLAELYARAPRGIELGLEKMHASCMRFDHPERQFAAIHVAGTNGKGSVCAMVESIARASGKKTGLYTSPHLCKFAERIRVDGEPISDETLERVLSDVLARAPELSFFEAATLTAFVAFAEAKVDIAIVEVGIGGRLDATNVLPSPLVTAITRIAFDHMDKLGDTIEEIAREKAGIIKPGVPVVLGPLAANARNVIEEIARERGAQTICITDSNVAERKIGSLFGFGHGLPGNYQADNGVIALHLAELAGFDETAFFGGMRDVHWPGRFERIDADDGAYLLDAAHNPDGAKALATAIAFARDVSPPRSWTGAQIDRETPVALVFGTLADKAWPEMIDELAPLTENRVYVAPNGRAPTPPENIASRFAGKIASNPIDACSAARALVGPSGLVVVCGSIFLVGEVRAHLLGLPRDPPIAL